jgi:hypothetical protein
MAPSPERPGCDSAPLYGTASSHAAAGVTTAQLRAAAHRAKRPGITTVRCADRGPSLAGPSSSRRTPTRNADLGNSIALTSAITPANPEQSPTVTPSPLRPPVITDEALPFALRSTRNRPRRAVRRGAAWPPTERPSSCLAVQWAVSRLGKWPHRRAVMVAECRMCRRRPQQDGSPSQQCRGPGMSGCPPCLGRPVRVLRQRPRVQRPPVQCPASGTCPASVRPVSARPVSGVRCPVSGASVRHPCPRCPHR